ncbi:MAG: hypothetical protein AAB602_00145 [Patescibacteria group bacterium]
MTIIRILFLSSILTSFAVAVTIPIYSRVGENGRTKWCVERLERIEHAKAIFAKASRATNGAPVYRDDIYDDHLIPEYKCPGGGKYIINAVGEKPTCTISGHTLSP